MVIRSLLLSPTSVHYLCVCIGAGRVSLIKLSPVQRAYEKGMKKSPSCLLGEGSLLQTPQLGVEFGKFTLLGLSHIKG